MHPFRRFSRTYAVWLTLFFCCQYARLSFSPLLPFPPSCHLVLFLSSHLTVLVTPSYFLSFPSSTLHLSLSPYSSSFSSSLAILLPYSFFSLSLHPSGTFKKGMKVGHRRMKRTINLSSAQALFAQDRESITEAYPGDVIGSAPH